MRTLRITVAVIVCGLGVMFLVDSNLQVNLPESEDETRELMEVIENLQISEDQLIH